MKKLLDDCFLSDVDRMRHHDAVNLLEQRLSPIAKKVLSPLRNATGAILAQKMKAPRNIPFCDNSAVDGYAFAHSDHEPTGGFFPIATRIPAGSAPLELPGFSAARIFTGAPMPGGADTVAMQEDCETHDQDGTRFVIVPGGLKKGANCRKSGEDLRKGDTIVQSGRRLRPQDVAAIASAGFDTVTVFSKLKVGIVSSGDEVLKPGQPYVEGHVYDANRYLLASLLASCPVETIDLGICPDQRDQVASLLEEASGQVDVILSTGGASRGEEDHFVKVLEDMGKCHLWQLAVKPGRPMSFGQIEDVPCFTLPGNPVAAWVCFLLYVYPSLLRLGGSTWKEPQRYRLPAGFTIDSKPDRREFLRGWVELDHAGNPSVHKFARDGSGLITGLRQATGLIEIAEETIRIDQGNLIDFIPFSEFGIPT